MRDLAGVWGSKAPRFWMIIKFLTIGDIIMKIICPNGVLEIAVANTFFSRFIGLMFLSEKAFCGGLLLTNCNSIHSFFMRFCIDVVFLDKSNKVVKVVKNLKPWGVVLPVANASSTLELNCGLADIYGIDVGLELVLKLSK